MYDITGLNRKLTLPFILILLFAAGCGDDDTSPQTPPDCCTAQPPVDAAQVDATTEIDAAAADAAPEERQNPLDGIGAVELVQDGFMFLEGPTWRDVEGVLLFTDIPGNRIHRVTADGTIDIFREPSNNANGLISDQDGLLLAAEHGSRRVSRTQADGTVVTVAEEYEGQRLNSPNDIAVRSDGVIYFTDPPYGLPNQGDGRELDFNGVFRVSADGTVVTAEWMGELDTRPNGLALSLDESILYVADTNDAVVRRFLVAADGSLTEDTDLATDVAGADGMVIDDDGNLFVTASDGVRVYAPTGELWGTIEFPEQPANCTFGGADGNILYVTARTGLYRVTLASE